MKVCILGVGRSGTTALYSLLQGVLAEESGGIGNVDCVYEPFLWDRQVFNDFYANVTGKFKYIDSLSVEGLYHHLKLPLFIRETRPYMDNEYLRSIFAPHGIESPSHGEGTPSHGEGTPSHGEGTPSHGEERPLLAKLIRGCGRFLLLNELCPQCKFIYIIRNPLDMINSAATRFSFHGRPFHRDDFSRFIPPVNEVYRQNFQSSQFETAVSREAVYWHYMNRFALESFQNSGARVLVVCYEDYLARREKWVDIICDFLGLPVKENYYSVSGTRSATATREIFLTKEEFQFLDGYRQIYDELLEKAGLNNLVDYKSIYSLYETFAPRSILENYFTGENPGYMNRRIQKLNHEMGRKIKEIRRLSSLLESE